MKEIKDYVEDDLLAKENVVGVAIGQKWTKGINTEEDAILVFVKDKKDISQLHARDVIPSAIDGVKTDVVGRTGVIRNQNVYTGKVRPIRAGYSCGHYKVTAGTIGGFFEDWEGEIVGLSNNHVLANLNTGRNEVDSIVQPGIYDGGSVSRDKIGVLKRYRTIGLTPYSRAYNHADRQHIWGYNLEDSAIFKPTVSQLNFDAPVIGQPVGFNDTVSVGQDLQKTGRTTGYTKAKVIATSFTAIVDYGRYDIKFKDQIATNAMSEGGDSGSVTLNMQNEAVGLLFAGSSSITLHNRIRYPRASFGLKVVNPVVLNESISYSLIVDGQTTSNSWSMGDFDVAVDYCKALAKDGKVARLEATYNVERVS